MDKVVCILSPEGYFTKERSKVGKCHPKGDKINITTSIIQEYIYIWFLVFGLKGHFVAFCTYKISKSVRYSDFGENGKNQYSSSRTEYLFQSTAAD